jgi:NHLM bacteriocin system ABC transporter ATP-binding protein
VNSLSPAQLLSGNARDPLPDCASGQVWVIRDGIVDVFVVIDAADGLPMRQHLLCSLDKGSMVRQLSADGFRVEAVPLTHSYLEMVDQAQLKVETWETGLGQWWAGAVGGLERLGLDRAQIASFIEDCHGRMVDQGTVVAARSGLYWVESGIVPQPFDRPASGDGSLPVPVGDHLWCVAAASGLAKKLTTASLLEAGILADAALAFDHRIADLARDLVLAQAEVNEQRLDHRWERESQQFEHLMAAAVESLDSRRLEKNEPCTRTALLQACRLVADWHGIAIAETASDDERGAVDTRLRQLAMSHRFQTRRVTLQGEWWREDLPALLVFDHDGGEPMALLPGKRGPMLHDPARPGAQPVDATRAASIALHCYSFAPPFSDQTRTLRDVAQFGLAGDKTLRLLALMALASALLAVLPPLVIKILFATAIPSSDFSLVIDLALSLLVVHLTTILINIGFEGTLVRLEGKAVRKLQTALFDRVLRLSNGYLQKMPLGKIHSKWMIFEKLHANGIGRVFITAMLTCILSVFSLVIMFVLFPTSATLVLGLTLAVATFASKIGRWQLESMSKGRFLEGHYWSVVTETLRGIRKLRLAGAEGRAFNRWFEFLVERRVRFLQGLRHRNRLQVVMATYESAILLITLIVFSFEYEVNSLPMGHFMAFLAATKTFTHAVALFAAALPDFSLALNDDLPDVLPFLAGDVENPAQRKAPGHLHGNVELAKLSFRYENSSRPVLDSLSLEARQGEFIALVGPSGCGKSTILKMLLGIEQPTSGAVFYDGRNLKQMDVVATRNQIGVVTQNAGLIPGTVFDYISANRNLTLAKAWEAARLAGVEDVIGNLPMGMFTFISESGAALSGGQIQRLMIARALAGRPRLLLLDEATSWLDNDTQQRIVETLSRLQITRVIIAHRLSTVRQADRIYVLDKGRLVETGTYEALLVRGGLFSELVRHQLI